MSTVIPIASDSFIYGYGTGGNGAVGVAVPDGYHAGGSGGGGVGGIGIMNDPGGDGGASAARNEAGAALDFVNGPEDDRPVHLTWVAERRRLKNELLKLNGALETLEATTKEKDIAIASLNKELTKISRKKQQSEDTLAQLVTSKAPKHNAARPSRFS